jgi:hypothetical protein
VVSGWLPAVEVSANCTAKGAEPLVGVAVKSAVGGTGADTVTRLLTVTVSCPSEEATDNVTEKEPAVVYTCEGFRAVLVWPSPKLQAHDVIAAEPGDDVSVNWTVNGAVPVAGTAVNAAVGATFAGGHAARIRALNKMNAWANRTFSIGQPPGSGRRPRRRVQSVAGNTIPNGRQGVTELFEVFSGAWEPRAVGLAVSARPEGCGLRGVQSTER